MCGEGREAFGAFAALLPWLGGRRRPARGTRPLSAMRSWLRPISASYFHHPTDISQRHRSGPRSQESEDRSPPCLESAPNISTHAHLPPWRRLRFGRLKLGVGFQMFRIACMQRTRTGAGHWPCAFRPKRPVASARGQTGNLTRSGATEVVQTFSSDSPTSP